MALLKGKRLIRKIVGAGQKISIMAEAESDEPNRPKTFTTLVYTGGELNVDGFDLPVVIDLQGLTNRNQVIANLDHDKTKRVGHVDHIDNDGFRLVLSGVLSAATPYRQEVIDSYKDGFNWQSSVEAEPIRVETIPVGTQVEVNGQTFEGPIYVAREAELYGFGFVTHGADDKTLAVIAATAATSKERKKMDFDSWLAAKGFAIETLSDEQIAALKVSYDAEQKALTANDDEDMVKARRVKANSTTPEDELKARVKAKLKASDLDESTLPPETLEQIIELVASEMEEDKINANEDEDKITASDGKFDVDELKASYARHEASIEAEIFRAKGLVPDEKLQSIKAKALEDAVSIKSRAINKRMPTSRFKLEAAAKLSDLKVAIVRAERPHLPAIHASSRDMNSKVIEAAMAQSLKLPNIEKHYKEQTLEAAHKSFKGRVGLQQVLIMAAANSGMRMQPGEKLHPGNLRDVLKHAFNDIHAASTLSLPGVFSNIANKELLEGFVEEDQTWREISVTKPVNDFKTVTSYRLLDTGEYEPLAQDGTIKHGTFGEESYTRAVDTYAKMWALTRQDIINDDMGAFDDLRNRLGRGASQKFNKLFWLTFLNNSSFFTSGRGNYITGATSNLGTDGVGLGLGVTQFRKMKSGAKDGAKRIGGNPDRLLVPPELEFAADKLYMGEKLNIGSGPGEDNVFRNKYKPIVCPWLSDPEFAGFSAKAWYLLRNPAILAAVVVSFLNGNETPTVESAEADFNTLGVLFRGYHDFGVDLAEYVAGVKSKGEA